MINSYLELNTIDAFLFEDRINAWLKKFPMCKWDECFFNGKQALIFASPEDLIAFRLAFGL